MTNTLAYFGAKFITVLWNRTKDIVLLISTQQMFHLRNKIKKPKNEVLRWFWGMTWGREYWRGKYHCTIDLLFDWLGLVSFANKNKNCQLSYSRFQTSQEVNGAVILPPLVFPACGNSLKLLVLICYNHFRNWLSIFVSKQTFFALSKLKCLWFFFNLTLCLSNLSFFAWSLNYFCKYFLF